MHMMGLAIYLFLQHTYVGYVSVIMNAFYNKMPMRNFSYMFTYFAYARPMCDRDTYDIFSLPYLGNSSSFYVSLHLTIYLFNFQTTSIASALSGCLQA